MSHLHATDKHLQFMQPDKHLQLNRDNAEDKIIWAFKAVQHIIQFCSHKM